MGVLYLYFELLSIITDIQGSDYKKPRFRTHAKMRWDDKYLYIGAFLEERDVWANQTKHDSVGTAKNMLLLLLAYF